MNIEQKAGVLWNRSFIAASIAYLFSTCAFYLFLPTIPLYLSGVLHVEESRIGIVLSSYVIALFFVRPFSGYLVDNTPRKLLYLISTICFIATFLGYYFAATVLFFVVLRFVHGIFWAVASVSANTVAIDVIPSARRSEGIGYFGVNSNVAMAIAPFIGVHIYKSYGFSALVTAALTLGVLAILTIALIHPPEREKSVEACKQPMSFDRFILVNALPILFNQLFLAFGWGALMAYAVLYGEHLGIKNPGYFFLFLAGGVVFSRLFSGRMVDRGYMHRVAVISLLIISPGFFFFSAIHSFAAFNASALVMGVGFGLILPALQTIYVNMTTAARRGTANSTYLIGFDLGVGIGMLIGGNIAQHFSGFSSLYFVSGILSVIALLLYIFNSKGVYERHKIK